MKEQVPQHCKDIFDIASPGINSCYKAVSVQRMGIGTGGETGQG